MRSFFRLLTHSYLKWEGSYKGEDGMVPNFQHRFFQSFLAFFPLLSRHVVKLFIGALCHLIQTVKILVVVHT